MSTRAGVRVSAIVLAGGRATRFGGPKLDVLVDGSPLLHRAIAAVGAAADEIVAVAAFDGHPSLPSSRVPLRLVRDPEPDAGPLLALAAGLAEARGEVAIVVGGDMPRLASAVLRSMADRLTGLDAGAIILAHPRAGRTPPDRPPRQSLPMAVRTAAARQAAEDAAASGRRSLQALLDRLRPVEVPAAEWLLLDPDGGTLLDVDEPSDLDQLERASPRRRSS